MNEECGEKDEALGICECEFAYVALGFFEISALMTKVDFIPKLSIIIDYIYRWRISDGCQNRCVLLM